MNGQTSAFRRAAAEKFISKNNPYQKREPVNFDLRAYSSYVRENNLTARQITPQLLEKFIIKN